MRRRAATLHLFVAYAVAGLLGGGVTDRLGAQEPMCEGVEPVAGDTVTLELVTDQLSRPVDVTSPPGDLERLFVVEQTGRIRVVSMADGSVAPAPFLDLRSRIVGGNGGEQGLLGLAFHPDYATNGTFFVNYTRRPGAVCSNARPLGCPGSVSAETVIARYRVSEDPNVADSDSEEVLLAFCQPYGNHNAGQLAFGPRDGYLYVSTGDGGSANDPCGSGQNPQSFLGKMLRLDVDGPADGERAYAIPPSNPFASADADPGDEVLDEVWATGLRNPWRFTFDPASGDLYIADVGQNAWEEINFQPGASAGGENYEWRVREGNHDHRGPSSFAPGAVTPPALEYPHQGGEYSGCSVTGGVVYRGCRMPDLHGTYFFADYCSGWVRSLRVEGGAAAGVRDRTADLGLGIFPTRLGAVSSFGTDARGEVYVCDLDGKLFRMVPGTANLPPVARIVTEPASPLLTLENGVATLLLDGGASENGEGAQDNLTFTWRRASGPSSASISERREPTTEVTLTEIGEYVFRLTVSDGFSSANAEVTVVVSETALATFRRGDANVDGEIDLTDAVYILSHVFLGMPEAVPCADALDADDDGALDTTDALRILNYRFGSGMVPPAPFPDCGADPTGDDALDCAEPGCG